MPPRTQIGPYRVEGLIGRGGMGEVYRAHDPKLGRDVAIKILPEAVAQDPDRRSRFEREARLLAALHHPHIATIFGVEDLDGAFALVMELVDGPTLAERIAGLKVKGSGLPQREALAIAAQLAEALDAAHERGIVHRDLKPANIKVTSDGTVKVLDFGLAMAVVGPGGQQSEVATQLVSQPGSILGTAAYMSPEQARGLAVDKRTDIWAFGCVLFEMLTGTPAFGGATASDILARILERDPDWSRLPASTPLNVQRLLQRCLQKDAKRRVRDIGDVRVEMQDGADELPFQVTSTSQRSRWAIAASVAIVTAAAVLGIQALRTRPVVDPLAVRLDVTTPPTTDPVSLAISPDGRKIVFAATIDGRSALWVRSLDSTAAQPLPGTDDAIFPFWSPDGRSLGFFSAGQLKRIDIDNGSIQALAAAPGGRGGAWNRDGTIVFQSFPGVTPLLRMSATGGQPVALPYMGRFPQFLPDGHHFLYYSPATLYSSGLHGVYVGDLNGTDSRSLLDADGPAVYASTGHLLFVRQETLFAQAFDLSRLALVGDPGVVAKQVVVRQLLFAAPVATSPAGLIAYRSGSGGGLRQLAWVDRSGKELRRVGESVATLNSPAMSPDGRRLAVHRAVNGNTDVWLIDLDRGIPTRLTSNPWAESGPTWSPDGSRLAIESTQHGRGDIYRMPATSGAPEEPLLRDDEEKWPTDWSSDGRFLLYNVRSSTSGRDIWALPMEAGQKPTPAVRTSFDEEDAQFSIDGRWIAYQSNESGQYEVYAQAFPSARHKLQLSTKGGAQPRWRRDGKELFYIALDGQLMVVPIRSASLEQGLDVGSPVRLFPARVGGAVQTNSRQQYVVSADGERFLMNTVTEEASAPITVLLNWKPMP